MPRDETRASAHPGFLDTAEPELISSAGASLRRARALVVNLGFQRSTASGTLARFLFAPGRAATATVRQANHGTEIRTGAYSSVLEDALDDMARYRALVHDLPRRFHQLPHEMQAAARRDPAALTHTGWDALLAPVFEHIARQRDDSIPIRTEEPERVLDPPWVFFPPLQTSRAPRVMARVRLQQLAATLFPIQPTPMPLPLALRQALGHRPLPERARVQFDPIGCAASPSSSRSGATRLGTS